MFKSLNNFFLGDGSKTGPRTTHFNKKSVGGTVYDEIKNKTDRLKAILSCPPLLKVIGLQATLFSLGKFYVYDKDNNEIVEHPILNLLQNPSEGKSMSQMLFEYMFWNCFGDSYTYIHSKLLNNESNFIKILKNPLIDIPNSVAKGAGKIINNTSKSDESKKTIKYFYDEDSNYEELRWNRVLHAPNLITLFNETEGISKIDVLYKQISNSGFATDSKNVNLRFSGKFLVAGKADIDNVNEIPLTEPEKNDIVRKANRGDAVQAIKSMIDIKRYVEDIAKLKLDDSFMSDYQTMGLVYDIPKDILEAFSSSTFENQSLAAGRLVEMTVQPKADKFAGDLTQHFSLNNEGLRLEMSFDHLSFMQEFRKKMFQLKKDQAEVFQKLLQAGVTLESINSFLDTNFEINEVNNENTTN